MYRYKIFRQLPDHSFTEIGQTVYLEDAEVVYERWHSAMITDTRGGILQTKNLTHDADHALF